jgi:hypothetical protein
MRNRRFNGAGPGPATSLILLCLCASVGPAEAQLVPSSTTALGMGGNHAAMARGLVALGINPANLGLSDNPSWSLAIPVLGGMQGLEPITLGDLLSTDGDFLPDEKKDAWLEEIRRADGQTGLGRAEITGLAVSVGPVAFQVHGQAFVDASLSPFASELILYRDEWATRPLPSDLDLAGSRADGSGVTTFALGAGFPVAEDLFGLEGERLAVGASLTYSLGNGVFLARDPQGLVDAGSPIALLAFPILQTDEDDYQFNGGSGVGLDLGVSWQGGPWGVSVSVANVFNTFNWDLDALAYYPGEVVVGPGGVSLDYDKRPAQQAPQVLLDQLDGLRFRPRMAIGTRWDAADAVTLAVDVQHRFGEGLPLGPPTRAGVGLDFQVVPQVSLQTGLTYVTDGVRAGVGAALTFGPFNLGGAYQLQRGGVGDAQLVALGISFNAR